VPIFFNDPLSIFKFGFKASDAAVFSADENASLKVDRSRGVLARATVWQIIVPESFPSLAFDTDYCGVVPLNDLPNAI
jgi:hypothetical protein